MLVGLDNADEVVQAHKDFNRGVMRVDIFGVKEGGAIDDPLVAPLRPAVPELEPGKSYLIETVIRTLKMDICSPREQRTPMKSGWRSKSGAAIA